MRWDATRQKSNSFIMAIRLGVTTCQQVIGAREQAYAWERRMANSRIF